MQNSSVINFVRSSRRTSWFSWPAVQFDFSSPDGDDLGRFLIKNNHASFLGAGEREGFQLKKKFFGYHWTFEHGSPYARIRYRLFSKPDITFADGTRYVMRLQRRWNIFRRPVPGEYEHLATFHRNEELIMVLQNNRRRPLFGSEVFMNMEGSITTELRDNQSICGMVLLFQTSLIVRSATAGSA